MLAWIRIIMEVLMFLPDLIGIIKAIIDLIRGEKDPVLRAQLSKEFNEAYQAARKGDRTLLDRLHKRLCPDGVCETPPAYTTSGHERK